MATFKVLLQRVCYAEVTVEAESAADAKRIFANDDTSFEYFTSSGNTWFGPDIKVKTVTRETERT